MGWSLPYGYVWGPNGTMIKDDSGAGEFGGGATEAPDFVAPAGQPLDENDNLYKDEDGVIRNRRQGTPGVPRAPGGGGNANPNDPGRWSNFDDPNRWAGQGAYGDGAATGGGGGASVGGSTGNVSGGGYGMPGGSTASVAYRPGGSSAGGGIMSYQGNPMASTQQGIDIANLNSGYMTSAGQSLMGINPQVGQMDRTLYDRYSQMLTDPNAFMENPVVKAALAKAQQAAGRSLAAGRMSKSGNAAQAISEATGQTLIGQYGQMAETMRQGAGLEASRWGAQTSANLDADRLRAGARSSAAQAFGGAGQLGLQAGQAGAATTADEEARNIRMAHFISQMTGSGAQGLQAGGFGTINTQNIYDPSRMWGQGTNGQYVPVYGATPNYTQSTFNLNSQYGGGSMPQFSNPTLRMT